MGLTAARRVAAIDCGTNSLRLLIADVDAGSGRLADVQRRMEIVRLGQGVDSTGRLAESALQRTFAVLTDYAAAIAQSGATAVRMVATSATRDAANAGEFADGVRSILQIDPEVISGAEEARLSFTGATTELAAAAAGRARGLDGAPGGGWPAPPYLVADIGGGSTEFVLGTPAAGVSAGSVAVADGSVPGGGAAAAASVPALAAASVNIGCVRMTERHLLGDPPRPEQITAATADIDAALEQVAASINVPAASMLVGLAGSVTTVAALALGLASYQPSRIHHALVPAARVHQVTAALLAQTRAERAGHGAMHPGRADVIAAGALILDRIMTRFGFGAVMASEHDILDGIAWSVAQPAARDPSPG
jgi:exopolyphosphatase / guanosine-5'-triphosphate,3'-diphosphate pyrophosphatase